MMMYLGIALLCLATVPGALCNEDIHKYMSPEEVLRVFHTDRGSVPEYEIVQVKFSNKFHKRDLSTGRKLQMEVFGENINLWLYPRDSILFAEDTPVYTARYSQNEPNEVHYRLRRYAFRKVGQILEDSNSLASLVIGKEDSGGNTINAFIESNGIGLKPLPRRVDEEYRRRRRSVGNLDDSNSTYHIIFKTLKSYEGNYSVPPVNVEALHQRASQSASEIPAILYPEILVVVDHSIRRAYKRDIFGLLQYIMAFWNGVDLKYRSLMNPRVRLHISYIVIAWDYNATPYISRHSYQRNAFNSYAAMEEATKFFFAVNKTFPLDSYDISVTMTLKEFGIDSDILGLAYLGDACSRDYIQNETMAVALIRDNTAFKGVFVAAHELGHLFGANHDTGHCVTWDGFIMAATMSSTPHSSDFSTCSMKSIDTQLKHSKLDCLFNPPWQHGNSLPRLMPGRLKNLEKQCEALNMGPPCQFEIGLPDICLHFYCWNKNGLCWPTGQGAADGTSCEEGSNKVCLHMQCVSSELPNTETAG